MSDTKKARKTLASKADDAVTVARAHGEAAADQARDRAERVVASTRDRVEAEADAAKTHLADGIAAGADRIASAADDMTPDAPHTNTVTAAADRLDDVAEAVRDMDLSVLPARLSAFARKNPAAFLGGAAILGIAVGRFFKAQGPQEPSGPDLSLHHIPAPDDAPGGSAPA